MKKSFAAGVLSLLLLLSNISYADSLLNKSSANKFIQDFYNAIKKHDYKKRSVKRTICNKSKPVGTLRRKNSLSLKISITSRLKKVCLAHFPLKWLKVKRF